MPTEYELIEEEIEPHKIGGRTASAAMLAWFLANVWRIEPEEVDDAICDGPGDKGIDAIVVNDELAELTIFQSKHRDTATRTQGDTELKSLVGAARWFKSPDSVDRLVAAHPNPELMRLLERQRIKERVGQGAHAARLVFVTNAQLDPAGRDYVRGVADQTPPLEVWDRPKLASVAEQTRRPELVPGAVTLRATATPTKTTLGSVPVVVGLVPAEQLVNLPGIEDLSIFARNVRLSEGRTRINKELGETIRNPAEHLLFPAYHNGLTLLTHGLNVRGRKLELDGVAVVNGCQSLLTLHSNREQISDVLQLLVKCVQVDAHDDLADKITYRANNQNPVDIRDQRSTDVVQRALQADVRKRYGSRFAYGIREGERFDVPVLDNKTAAQFIMAIYLGEPWNAVRKVRLFDDDYRRIFSRHIDAHKLYLMRLLGSLLEDNRPLLRPDLAASFASVRLTLAHLLAQVVRQTERGSQLLDEPQLWLPRRETSTRDALDNLLEDIIESVNFYVENEVTEQGETFDPKVAFKSHTGVKALEHDVLRSARKETRKDPGYGFNLGPAPAVNKSKRVKRRRS